MTDAIIVGCVGALIGFSISIVISAWRFTVRLIVVEHERDEWQRKAEMFAERLRDVEPREARFRQALGYYADERTWSAEGRQHSPAFKDRGRIAREALK